jgi:putative transposase
MSSMQYHNDRLPSGPVQRRKSMRLPGYDYTMAGAYFITVCTYNREYLFGSISNNVMLINKYGGIVIDELSKSAKMRREIETDIFVVMPNHIHVIIIIHGGRGDRPVAPTASVASGPMPGSIGAFIAGFKSIVTKRINKMRRTPGAHVWQRSYFDRIIRNDREMDSIREYILDNPLNWEADEEYRGNEGK